MQNLEEHFKAHCKLLIISISELGQLTGVAAVLRFPLPDLVEEFMNDEDTDSDGWHQV